MASQVSVRSVVDGTVFKLLDGMTWFFGPLAFQRRVSVTKSVPGKLRLIPSKSSFSRDRCSGNFWGKYLRQGGSTMGQPLKSMVRWLSVATALVAAIVVGYLILTFPHPSPQAPTTFDFISYTNTDGQTEALFRLDHPPRSVRADGIWELRYRTSAGWVRPSAPTVNFGCFGWDGTGSLVAISVETTNLPARVEMDIWTRRKGIRGLYGLLMDGWTKLVGKPPELRGDVLYLTNQTATLPSNP